MRRQRIQLVKRQLLATDAAPVNPKPYVPRWVFVGKMGVFNLIKVCIGRANGNYPTRNSLHCLCRLFLFVKLGGIANDSFKTRNVCGE